MNRVIANRLHFVGAGLLAATAITAAVAVAHWEATVRPANGTCHNFDHGVTVCVPTGSHGWPTRIEEDGTASYPDGTMYDPQRGCFRTLYSQV